MAIAPDPRSELVELGSARLRQLTRAPSREVRFLIAADREMRRQAWEEAKHVKSVERLRREDQEAEREREAMFRSFRVRYHRSWGESRLGARKRKSAWIIQPGKMANIWPSAYRLPFVTRDGRHFVFLRVRYYSARDCPPGHCVERAQYFIEGAFELSDGSFCFSSNLGETEDEILSGIDATEGVNRSPASNTKLMLHMIVQLEHGLTPEEQFATLKRYCEDVFGRQGLPYIVVLHPPSEEGDQRNWHAHIMFSFRPVMRTAPYEWEFGRHLRTDLDTPEQFGRLRKLWADHLNFACEKAGLDKRFTHLSYAAAGLDVVPRHHLGEALNAKVRRGERVELNEINKRIIRRNLFKRALREAGSAMTAVAAALQAEMEQVKRAKLRAQVLADALRERMRKPDMIDPGAPPPAASAPSPDHNAQTSNRVADDGVILGEGFVATLPTEAPPSAQGLFYPFRPAPLSAGQAPPAAPGEIALPDAFESLVVSSHSPPLHPSQDRPDLGQPDIPTVEAGQAPPSYPQAAPLVVPSLEVGAPAPAMTAPEISERASPPSLESGGVPPKQPERVKLGKVQPVELDVGLPPPEAPSNAVLEAPAHIPLAQSANPPPAILDTQLPNAAAPCLDAGTMPPSYPHISIASLRAPPIIPPSDHPPAAPVDIANDMFSALNRPTPPPPEPDPAPEREPEIETEEDEDDGEEAIGQPEDALGYDMSMWWRDILRREGPAKPRKGKDADEGKARTIRQKAASDSASSDTATHGLARVLATREEASARRPTPPLQPQKAPENRHPLDDILDAEFEHIEAGALGYANIADEKRVAAQRAQTATALARRDGLDREAAEFILSLVPRLCRKADSKAVKEGDDAIIDKVEADKRARLRRALADEKLRKLWRLLLARLEEAGKRHAKRLGEKWLAADRSNDKKRDHLAWLAWRAHERWPDTATSPQPRRMIEQAKAHDENLKKLELARRQNGYGPGR
ncbi:MAG: MobA/MobL family protein [Erythrobacter sp.]